jgi:hypothetical protein
VEGWAWHDAAVRDLDANGHRLSRQAVAGVPVNNLALAKAMADIQAELERSLERQAIPLGELDASRLPVPKTWTIDGQVFDVEATTISYDASSFSATYNLLLKPRGVTMVLLTANAEDDYFPMCPPWVEQEAPWRGY